MIRIDRLVPVPEKSPHNWLHRAMRAFFLERRLPYALHTRLDKCLARIGFPIKSEEICGQIVSYRRATYDEQFVQTVLKEKEYFINEYYTPSGNQTIVDIGANIGTFTLAAKWVAPRARVISVEPVPENVKILRRNVNQNNLSDVTIEPAAVTCSNGYCDLFIALPGFHSLKLDRHLGNIRVPSITIPQIFDAYGIETCDLLKIDCEGAEFDFLPNLDDKTWRRIQRLAMEFSAPIPLEEWHFPRPTPQQRAKKKAFAELMIGLLEDKGFIIDQYVDCVEFRAGYIFARKPATD